MSWIRLQKEDDGRVIASGSHACSLGHRIVLPDGFACGVYAGWQWDGRELHLDNDRYGLFPLFSSMTANSCTIASDLETLLDLGADRTLDRDAFAAFLRLGFFLDDDTPFAAIRAVPPRARLQWTPTGPQIFGTWPSVTTHDISRNEAVDGFIDLFRTAIARRLPRGGFELPLSGGKDSRHILFELLRAGSTPVACITLPHFPPRANVDIAIAQAVCTRVGVPHIVIPQRRDRVAAEREKNIRTHFCAEEAVQWIALSDRLASTSVETFDGVAGDVLSQSSYLTPELHEVFEHGDVHAIARFFATMPDVWLPEAGVAALVSAEILREMTLDRAQARFERALGRHIGAPNPVGSFFFWNRTRREVALAPYGLLRDLVVYAPYVDRELFDLLAGLPAELMLDGTLHTEAIARAFPSYADIPYEGKGRIASNRPLQRAFARGLLRILTGPSSILNRRALFPGVAATAVDGHPTRVWHGAMTVYLSQLDQLMLA